MSSRNRVIAIVIGALLLLVGLNVTIWNRERLLAEGRIVYLPLAPVDPRSLMQGDYMALRFAIAREMSGIDKRAEADGAVVVQVGVDRVGRFLRIDGGEPLKADEQRITYRVRNREVKIVTNGYFFQEGQANRFSGARYGILRVAGNGTALLEGLADERLAMIPVTAAPGDPKE